MRWVIASGNANKRKEIEAILASLDITVLASDETMFVEVDEDADTFSGNARKKAEAFARANGLPALADDSGLCVEALGGAPGVYSARFAGTHATDAMNNAKLLEQMRGETNRRAYFICSLYVAFPDGRQGIACEGRVNGDIVTQMMGDAGFGYDPLFYSHELGKTFACATAEEKAAVSHRGRALRALHQCVHDKLWGHNT